jgi:NADPH2:quinone reductase
MKAAIVATAGHPPLFGHTARPDLASTIPPGFPIDEPKVPQRPPGPHPASLVEVSYSAINPIDLHVASGRFFQGAPRVPYIPGVEGAGRVVESGTYPAGTRVRFELGHPGYGANGSMAEYVVVDDAGLVELPESVTDAHAAALGVAAITAGRALDLGELAMGETVLVLGAAGAVGSMAIQLARLRGAARVVAAGRSPAGLERTRALGADATVSLSDRSVAELADDFRKAGLGGIDVIVDPLWGDPAMAAIQAGNFGVRLVNCGQAAQPTTEFASVALRNHRATVRGISTAMDGFDVRRARFVEALEHLAAGRLTVDYAVYSLEQVAAAWSAQAESPGTKLLLDVRSSTKADGGSTECS